MKLVAVLAVILVCSCVQVGDSGNCDEPCAGTRYTTTVVSDSVTAEYLIGNQVNAETSFGSAEANSSCWITLPKGYVIAGSNGATATDTTFTVRCSDSLGNVTGVDFVFSPALWDTALTAVIEPQTIWGYEGNAGSNCSAQLTQSSAVLVKKRTGDLRVGPDEVDDDFEREYEIAFDSFDAHLACRYDTSLRFSFRLHQGPTDIFYDETNGCQCE